MEEQENTTEKQASRNAGTTSPRSGGLGGHSSGHSSCRASSGLRLANPILYNSLRENAMSMRAHPTEAESIMWQLLKENTLGVRFRQQYVIDEYIVDFVALKQKLIIEIDGGYHQEEGQTEKDKERDRRLYDLGFKTIRFSNDDVFKQSEWIIKAIKSELNK